MLTLEETKILQFLRRQVVASLPELCQRCLPGTSPEWVQRVLADLEWLGYVVVFDGAGGDLTVQTTERGKTCVVS